MRKHDFTPDLWEHHNHGLELVSSIRFLVGSVEGWMAKRAESQRIQRIQRAYSRSRLILARNPYSRGRFATTYDAANVQISIAQGKDPLIKSWDDGRREEAEGERCVNWHEVAVRNFKSLLHCFDFAVLNSERDELDEGVTEPQYFPVNEIDVVKQTQIVSGHLEQMTRFEKLSHVLKMMEFQVRRITPRIKAEFALAITLVNEIGPDRTEDDDELDGEPIIERNAARDDRFIEMRKAGNTLKEIAEAIYDETGEEFSAQRVDAAITRRCKNLGVEKPLAIEKHKNVPNGKSPKIAKNSKQNRKPRRST